MLRPVEWNKTKGVDIISPLLLLLELSDMISVLFCYLYFVGLVIDHVWLMHYFMSE